MKEAKHHSIIAELVRRMTSRKLWTFLLSVGVCWLCLERGVNHLYALPKEAIAVYGGMFLCVMGAITVMACKYMGIDNVSISSATSVQGAISAATQALTENRNIHEEHIERIEHVVVEGQDGAPTRRPFKPEDHAAEPNE